MTGTLLAVAQNLNAEIVHFSYKYVTPTAVKIIDHNLITERLLTKKEIISSIFIPFTHGNSNGLACVWTKIYLNSFLKNNNLSFKTNYQKGEDWLFNLQAFQCVSRIVAVPGAFYNYIRQNQNSIMHSYRRNEVAKMDISISYIFDLNRKYDLNQENAILKNHVLQSLIFMMRVFRNEPFCTALYLNKKIKKKKYFEMTIHENAYLKLGFPFKTIGFFFKIKFNIIAYALIFIASKFIKKIMH